MFTSGSSGIGFICNSLCKIFQERLNPFHTAPYYKKLDRTCWRWTLIGGFIDNSSSQSENIFVKYIFILNLLLISSSFANTGSSQATESSLSTEDSEKLHFELINKLIDQGTLSLKGKKGCESFVQFKQDTVGRFMAWSLSFYSRDQANSVDVSCDKQKTEKTCSVNFSADSKGNSPWSCGLRFLYKMKNRQIQSSSIECIGTC